MILNRQCYHNGPPVVVNKSAVRCLCQTLWRVLSAGDAPIMSEGRGCPCVRSVSTGYLNRASVASVGASQVARGNPADAWAPTPIARDGCVPGADGVLTHSLWESAMAEMRSSATLQQMWALQLLVIPGIGSARANTIVQGDFKVPAALAAAYRATSTPEEGKALLASLTPPPGCARIPTHVSDNMCQLFVLRDYAAVAPRELVWRGA